MACHQSFKGERVQGKSSLTEIRYIIINQLLEFAYGMLLCEYNYTLFMTAIIGTRQIANTNYGVCVQTAAGYCSIQWTQTPNDPYSFTVSGDTGGIDTALLGKNDNYAEA
jgi:hypothetical protein